jgi:hypothetical protein
MKKILREKKEPSANGAILSDFEINQLIAKEVIDQRLDVPVTKYNIRQLARCITGLEGERKNFVNMNE